LTKPSTNQRLRTNKPRPNLRVSRWAGMNPEHAVRGVSRFNINNGQRRHIVQESLPSSGPIPATAPKAKRTAKITSACPQCGQHRLVPISRRGVDRLFGLFVSLRRFRCKNLECGWEGNLVKSQTLRRTVEHMPSIKKKGHWIMLTANSIMLLIILVILVSLIIGWFDGSLEGYDGIFSIFKRTQ
jgi:hypothetical protein